MNRPLRYGLAAAYLFLMLLPVYIFAYQRPGLAMTPATLFPLFGLMAFSLVAMQVIIGSNMRRLRPVMGPGLLKFHRYQGMLALILSLLHPLMIVLTFGLWDAVWTKSFLPASLRGFVLFGQLALVLMIATVGSAFLAWKFQKLTTLWRVIHFANYGVFVFAWIHSWFIGSDISSTPLKWVWLFYLGAWCVSLLLRIGDPRAKVEAPPASTEVEA